MDWLSIMACDGLVLKHQAIISLNTDNLITPPQTSSNRLTHYNLAAQNFEANGVTAGLHKANDIFFMSAKSRYS